MFFLVCPAWKFKLNLKLRRTPPDCPAWDGRVVRTVCCMVICNMNKLWISDYNNITKAFSCSNYTFINKINIFSKTKKTLHLLKIGFISCLDRFSRQNPSKSLTENMKKLTLISTLQSNATNMRNITKDDFFSYQYPCLDCRLMLSNCQRNASIYTRIFWHRK